MRLTNYEDGLQKRLADPRHATEYLAQVLAEKDGAAFLIAPKDVLEAGGARANDGGLCSDKSFARLSNRWLKRRRR